MKRTYMLAAALVVMLGTAAAQTFSERGKPLFKDDFSAATLDSHWGGKLGTWELADGAVKISERAEDKHAAVRRYPLKYHDAIFEFSFRFEGAKAIHLSINNKGGHVCRLVITPTGMVLQTDKPNATSNIKPARLGALMVPVEAGKWHKVVLEVRGQRMTAQMDGGKIFSGENPAVDVDKADFGFAVSGVSALLDNVAVYEVRQ